MVVLRMCLKDGKILFVGQLNESKKTKTYQRLKVFEDLGYNVKMISILPEQKEKIESGFIDKVFHKLGYPLDRVFVNKKIIDLVSKFKPEYLWIEKCLMIKPNTLNKIKKIQNDLSIIFFSEDDMYSRHNQSKYFMKNIKYYDYFVTTKSFNLEELPKIGVKNLIYIDKSYHINTHKPIELSEKDLEIYSSDVGFVGSFEKERFEDILFLAQNGIKVKIWGNGWAKVKGKHDNIEIKNKAIYGNEYVKAICATKINLCFLRKINRDLHTGRSIEIPACKGFMLAERTSEHTRLFDEDVEAVFFDSKVELLEKVNYYLDNDTEREKIALNGMNKCIEGEYNHANRLKYVMERICINCESNY
jgi:spore maturation protein CgeB